MSENGWYSVDRLPDDICPDCGSDLEVEAALYLAQTLLEPAEYSYKFTCHECGWTETE